MRVSFDQKSDALYVSLIGNEPVARTEQVDPGTLVDLDRVGKVIGVEVLQPARSWPLEDILKRYGVSDEDSAVLRRLFLGRESDRRYPFAPQGQVAAIA